VLALLAATCGFPQSRTAPPKPKLVVAIVIDQFRYDYLTRFRANYTAGIAELLDRGAVFTDARYRQFPTVTAVGHSILLSGAMPALSGIIDNQWFDRALNRQVTSVSDDATELLGGAGPGSSPRRLLASTLGDEMKAASRGGCRVIGISLKDRAAILPSGHAADGAYWFDPRAGAFVSSTFYFKELPEWVRGFNAKRPADGYGNAQWTPLEPSPDYPDFRKKMPGGGPELYAALEASPYANELVEAFAERAIEAERLGGHAAADLLTVSFSANDYVGHQMGPDSAEVRDMALRVDRSIGKLLAFLDQRLGSGHVVVVLTADHGVAPLPEVLAERKMPGGRQSAKVVLDAIQGALSERFGEGRWVAGASTAGAYLNRDLIASKKLDEAQVEEEAAKAARAVPHVLRVYTRAQLVAGKAGDDAVGQAVANGSCASRSGDVFIVMEPYWIEVEHGTTHGSPFDYDTHVPVIFMGPGIKPGRYDGTIAPNDIAPTLATLLGVETPSCSAGRALAEMLVR
jgi:arylsulfatase A-like enzyme